MTTTLPQHKVILVVEDSPAIRESLRLTLELEGYEVQQAENGQLGWKPSNTSCPT